MHHQPRVELFTPLRVAGAPPSKSLTPARVTEGRFVDTGEAFRRVDSWTTKSTAHADLGRRWTGTTRFLMRTGCDETTEKEATAPVEEALGEAVADRRGESGGARCRAAIRRAWAAQDRCSQLRVNRELSNRTAQAEGAQSGGGEEATARAPAPRELPLEKDVEEKESSEHNT